MNNYSDLAILVPTINESTLGDVVAAAIEQAPGAEIMILGYGEAAQIAEKYQVQFLDLKEKTRKSIAINRALTATQKDWIIVLDADAIPLPGWGKGMLDEFKKGRRLFSGSVDISEGNFWMHVYNLGMLHEFNSDRPSSARKHLPAFSLGFTRSAFEEIGPFSEEIIRSQDYEWSLRATKKNITPWFAAGPSVLHIPINKNTFSSVWRYWVNSGMDNLTIRRMYGDILKTPFFMKWPLFILIFSPLLALFPTARILFTTPKYFLFHFYYMPFVYLTKIAWCIGVYKNS